MNDLSLQRGRGLFLNKYCTLKHPTMGEIESLFYEDYESGNTKVFGYDAYSQLLYSLILSPKDVADILWFENQVWYEDIQSDWDFFIERAIASGKVIDNVEVNLDGLNITTKALALDGCIKQALNYFTGLDGDFVFIQKMIENSDKMQILLFNTKNKKIANENVVYIDENCFKFTEHYYYLTVDYLKKINWIKIEYDFVKGANKNSKIYILQHDYKQRKKNKKQFKDISTINSALIAKGQKNTWDMPIYLFYDCYYRLVKIDEYKNTMSALYAGGIDTKKNPINWEKVDWSSIITI